MKIEFYPEKSALGSFIVGYSILQASALSRHDVSAVTVPDGFVEMYFSRYNTVSIKMNSQKHIAQLSAGFILGQTEKAIEFNLAGDMELISVKIHPWATKVLFPDKAVIYRDRSCAIDDIGDKTLSLLQDQVLHCKTNQEAIKAIRNYMARLIGGQAPYSKLIYYCINYIYQNYKNFKVKELSAHLNISSQYLQRQFLEHLGISPKQFARVIRIRRLTEYHKSQPKTSLTTLAYKYGYFDQSHFIKDFQIVTDTSPKSFFDRRNLVSSNYHSNHH